MDAETVKVWYELEEQYCDENWKFVPENRKENLTLGVLGPTGHFLLGRLKNLKKEEEYQFRVDIKDSDKIDVDLKKSGIKKLFKSFQGHHPRQSSVDAHDFFISLPGHQNSIFEGTLKVRMKTMEGTFTADAILVKETQETGIKLKLG